MDDDSPSIRAILDHNGGFGSQSDWIEYARSHRFERVASLRLPYCPDCGGPPAGVERWGQYVYYSTLIHLRECERCHLIWADAQIDPKIIQEHFERVYKDDTYFREARQPIFEHLSGVIDRIAGRGARILDIGGARGDLMSDLVARRPDVLPTVNDLSAVATAWARDKLGFPTITGGAETLADCSEQYDIVVLSDVIYYEPNLPLLWSALGKLIRPGGSVVLRIPNKTHLVRLGQLWLNVIRRNRDLQDRVPFHNPEHIFVLRRRYVRDRLLRIGFHKVSFGPSPLLAKRSIPQMLQRGTWHVARALHHATPGDVVLTPSTIVVATQFAPP